MSDNAWAFLSVLVLQAANAFISYTNGRKANTIHELVNSQFSAAKAEIAEAKTEIASLRAVVASLTGQTEDKVRAAVASEQLRAVPALPKQS